MPVASAGRLRSEHVIGQAQRDEWDVRHHDQENQQDTQPGQRGFGDLHEIHASHAAGYEQVQANRRRHHADLHIHHHNDAQMDGVNTQRRSNGEQNRR